MALRLFRPCQIAAQERWQDRADRRYARLRHYSVSSNGGDENESAEVVRRFGV